MSKGLDRSGSWRKARRIFRKLEEKGSPLHRETSKRRRSTLGGCQAVASPTPPKEVYSTEILRRCVNSSV
jgi:hypothetical protein